MQYQSQMWIMTYKMSYVAQYTTQNTNPEAVKPAVSFILTENNQIHAVTPKLWLPFVLLLL